jgi:MYXO-CTERM domain-containing protein
MKTKRRQTLVHFTLAVFIGALTGGTARANIVSFPVAETAVMDDTTISSPITFDAANYGFSSTLPAPPAGFFFTIAFSKVSGLATTPVQVYLTDIPLPTSNLPFTNGCLSSPNDCVHETAWTYGPADSSGPTGTLTSQVFSFSGPNAAADAAKVQGWANISNIFLALGGGSSDKVGTCGNCTSATPQTTLTLVSATTPEPGTAAFVLLAVGAAALVRRRTLGSKLSRLAEDFKR